MKENTSKQVFFFIKKHLQKLLFLYNEYAVRGNSNGKYSE